MADEKGMKSVGEGADHSSHVDRLNAALDKLARKRGGEAETARETAWNTQGAEAWRRCVVKVVRPTVLELAGLLMKGGLEGVTVTPAGPKRDAVYGEPIGEMDATFVGIQVPDENGLPTKLEFRFGGAQLGSEPLVESTAKGGKDLFPISAVTEDQIRLKVLAFLEHLGS